MSASVCLRRGFGVHIPVHSLSVSLVGIARKRDTRRIEMPSAAYLTAVCVMMCLCASTLAQSTSVYRTALYESSACSAASLVALVETQDARCDPSNRWQIPTAVAPDGICRPDAVYPVLYSIITCTTADASTFLQDIASSARVSGGTLMVTSDQTTGALAKRTWNAANFSVVNSLGYATTYSVTA